jgi:hypothetical protein
MGSDAINSPASGRAVSFPYVRKTCPAPSAYDRMEQYDSLFPEAQRLINTGEEGAAAVLFGRLSEYLGEAATILKQIHEEKHAQ